MKHAGVAGESPGLNTRAYRLFTRPSLASFCASNLVATVTNNTANQTVHNLSKNNVFGVQLVVDVPTQGVNTATRIYEVEVECGAAERRGPETFWLQLTAWERSTAAKRTGPAARMGATTHP